MDPLAQYYTSVASYGWGLYYGGFGPVWTRDDIGGLRICCVQIISIGNRFHDSVQLQTNASSSQLLTTSDLGLLAARSS